MAWIKENLVGKKFGKLTAVKKARKVGSRWMCRCECGTTKEIVAYRLLSGNDKSCGCVKRTVLGDATRTHGRANSRITGYADRTYGIWQAIRARCTNPSHNHWKDYGGRGIKVCKRWNSFEKFIQDMGDAPTGLTIERLNVNGNYTPSNCVWATYAQQAKNKRKKI